MKAKVKDCRHVPISPGSIRSSALSCGHAPPSHYPDVLKLFAVDRIQNTVGSYEFHRTLDVDVGHDPTLVILKTAEAGEARAQPKPRSHTGSSLRWSCSAARCP